MKRLQLLLLPFFVVCVLLGTGCAQQTADGADATAEGAASEAPAEAAEWLTNHEQALALAKEQGKPILMNFTGSDWCPPCKMLKRDVFDTKAFSDYATENLILLELDYPFGYKQEPELVKQNEALQQTFKIEGFPTLIVLDPQGKEQRRTVGYMEGGPDAFIRWVKG